MNKTVTINLAGLVFYIEENAYQILKEYLSAIKSHFKNEEGCEEIVSDIEARLAELLKANTHEGKQVLLESDVQAAIKIMGKPEDFTDESSDTEARDSSQENRNFAYKTHTRRVFRDGDNKILGGVCSGMASYFDTDPLWIRLALVVLFFGFGSGLLLYIILWIIIPVAKTTAEKLEMRGDPIDINTISQTIKEEAEQFKGRVQDLGNGIKKEYQRNQGAGAKLGDLLYTIFHGLFKVISKIAGVLFVLFGILLFIALLLVLFSVGNIDGLSMHEFFDAFAGKDFSLFWFKVSLALCIGIPLCMIVYKGMKLLLGIKTSYRWLNLSAGVLWLVGLVMCLYLTVTILNDFSVETPLKKQMDVHFNANDTLFIKAISVYKRNDSDVDFELEDQRWQISNNQIPALWWGKPRVKLITSENDSVSVFMIKTASGKHKTEASLRAKNINYQATQQGPVLILNNSFSFVSTDKYRNQGTEILIKLPKNKIIYLDNSLKNLLHLVENTNGISDSEMGGKYWKMTENGLTCLSCTQEDLLNAEDKEEIETGDIDIHDSDGDAHVHVGKNGIEINAKDAHVKISSDGIKVEEKK